MRRWIPTTGVAGLLVPVAAAAQFDGKELFYLAPDPLLMSVPVAPGEVIRFGTPQGLFRIQTEQGQRRNVYDVSPDGKRFLFLVPVGEANTPMTAT